MNTKIMTAFKIASVITFLFLIEGCANTSLVQAKLTASEARNKDLNDRLELAEGRIQEIQSEASKNDAECQKVMAKLHQIEHSASELYATEKPVVIRMATDAYDAAKPVVEQKANEAYTWTTEQIRAHLPKPDPTNTPAR
jgi:chromosome segregation ATPase